MKKLIIILSILILTICSVFADETHSVRVTAKIEAKNPLFALKASLVPGVFDDAGSDKDADNMLGWETVEKSIQKEDVKVYFEIVQKDSANKFGEKYSLTVESSGMILSFNEDGTPLAPNADIHRTTQGTISEVTPINNEKANVTVTTSESVTKDAISLVAEYKGKVEDGTPIATFTVTWAKDVNAPDGIYQASVILNVSPL